jgi:putative adenylate-forming enzyme
MDNFDAWITDPQIRLDGVQVFIDDVANVGQLYLDQFAIWTSSGTTGEPGIFIQDKSALNVYSALALIRGIKAWVSPKHLLGFFRQGLQGALIIAIGGHWASDAVQEQIRAWNSYLAEHIHAYSVVEPIPQIVDQLNQQTPTILLGYSTALQLLAEQQMSGDLAISPSLVISAAERLTPSARQLIAEAFKCFPRDLYAAAEFMGIAYSCDHGWLHVNSDWVMFEPVDENYQPVPLGQPSHTVLLTNLANRIQPLIRYDLGDRVTLSPERCPCGNALPAIQVEGRTDDVLYLEAEDGTQIPVLPMAFETVVELVPGVGQYQVLQTAPATLSLRLEGPPELGRVIQKCMREYLISVGLPSVEVELAYEAPIRDPVSRKVQRVITALEC